MERENHIIEKPEIAVFWFRRDLRADDNHALYNALISGNPVLPVFIFDTEILSQLEEKSDRRVNFIFQTLEAINREFQHNYQSGIQFYYGSPEEVFLEIINSYHVKSVFCNEDYEPYAIRRDAKVKAVLNEKGVSFLSFKDQVVFHKNDIVKKDGNPYTVYTPYSNAWLTKFRENSPEHFPSEEHLDRLWKFTPENFGIEKTGFLTTGYKYISPQTDKDIIMNYADTRNFPYLTHGVSGMSVHLRFGTVSIRRLVSQAAAWSEVYLKELIWREFFMQILYHFPRVENHSFKEKYDNIKWELNELHFRKWCEGKTGYPMVDAGMRQLNSTGVMHNRVRMITASFLTKHLLIDWRWGEAYFANKLLDYDLAANNGNWQWVAGCGCDAAPYFRIFNPAEQQKKFDPEMNYVKKWIPEYGTKHYPDPIVEHTFARNRVLERFKKALEIKQNY